MTPTVTITFTPEEAAFVRAGLAAYMTELAKVTEGGPETDIATKARCRELRDQCRDLAIRVSNESAAALNPGDAA